MSRRTVPAAAKLVLSVIYGEEAAFESLRPRLEERFGPVESASDRFPFDFTEYYAKEMGERLVRRFVVMRDPVARDALAAIKIAAEALEDGMAVAGRRAVNVDPGLLTEENFILATGKNYSHRVYLGDGVYADLALVYRKGAYRPLPWTYPDYASEGVRTYLGGVRASLTGAAAPHGGDRACG